jgi:hypothetical protein
MAKSSSPLLFTVFLFCFWNIYELQTTTALIVNSPPSLAGYMLSLLTPDVGSYPPLAPGIFNKTLVHTIPADACSNLTNPEALV